MKGIEYYMSKAIANYTNGNYQVIILENGTKIRYNEEETLTPDHFESVDIKITNKCVHNCPYCHEASFPNGEHADFNKYMSFLETIHPHTELAIGGGNPLLHPQLDSFLQYCKDKQFIPSMTVNWQDFVSEHDRLMKYEEDKLLYGIGISMPFVDIGIENKKNLYSLIQETPNAVCHVILGLHTLVDMLELSNMVDSPRVLFLGFKSFRKGNDYLGLHAPEVLNNISDIATYLFRMKQGLVKDWKFNPMAFDNLALQQLDLKDRLSPSPFYMGDEGQFTLFIDLVTGEYAKSSTSRDRFPIANKNADQIFQHIRTGKEPQ